MPPFSFCLIHDVKLSKGIQIFLGVALLLLSVSHWFPLGLNVLELLGAFAHFTLLLSWLIILLTSVCRMPILRGFAIMSSVICAFLIAPHFKSIDTSNETTFSVGQFNVYHHNPSPQRALEQILLQNSDIISIHELNSDWAGSVDSMIKSVYPYSIEEPWEHCCYGAGFYSKFPIVDYEVKILAEIPVVFTTIEIEGQLIRIISFHALTPIFPNQTTERNEQMQFIAEFIEKENKPSIIFGDFNIVPWETAFQDFLETGKLQEVPCGFQATYPMDMGFPLIPIDHINYSNEFEPTNCGSITIEGSDHKGIHASFKLKD